MTSLMNIFDRFSKSKRDSSTPEAPASGMTRATWNGQVIAESPATISVDGYTYFPRESVRWELMTPSDTTSVCGWKGTANYYNIVVGGQSNPNAAWSYRNPRPAANQIKGYIGFWRGVKIDH